MVVVIEGNYDLLFTEFTPQNSAPLKSFLFTFNFCLSFDLCLPKTTPLSQ